MTSITLTRILHLFLLRVIPEERHGQTQPVCDMSMRECVFPIGQFMLDITGKKRGTVGRVCEPNDIYRSPYRCHNPLIFGNRRWNGRRAILGLNVRIHRDNHLDNQDGWIWPLTLLTSHIGRLGFVVVVAAAAILDANG